MVGKIRANTRAKYLRAVESNLRGERKLWLALNDAVIIKREMLIGGQKNQNAKTAQQKNMDAEQSFLYAQHMKLSALRLDWLQQSNLTAAQKFPYAHRRHWLQEKNLTASQDFPYAQHTESSAHKWPWLQQIHLIIVQRFPLRMPSIQNCLLSDNIDCSK